MRESGLEQVSVLKYPNLKVIFTCILKKNFYIMRDIVIGYLKQMQRKKFSNHIFCLPESRRSSNYSFKFGMCLLSWAEP